MHFPVFFSPMDANPHGEMNTSQAKGGRITLSPVRVVRSNSNVMATPRNEKKKKKQDQAREIPRRCMRIHYTVRVSP